MSRTTLCGVANYPNSDCGVGTGVFNFSNSDFALLSVTQSQIRPCWQWHRARLFGVGRKLITQSQAQRCRQFRSTRLGCIGNYSEYDSAVLLITRMWRACNLTAFTPCLTGLVDHLFASRHEGPGFKTPGGTSVKPGFSCCIVSLHWWPQHDWSLWPRLRWASSKPSQGHRANNVDLTQLFCTGFMLTAGPPSGFTTAIVGCWGGSPEEILQYHCIHTQSYWSSGSDPWLPVMRDPGSIPRGVLTCMWNWDSPDSVVSLQGARFYDVKDEIRCRGNMCCW